MFGRSATRAVRSSLHLRPARLSNCRTSSQPPRHLTRSSIPCRSFYASRSAFKGLSPESSDPEPPNPQPVAGGASHVTDPADITVDQYHELADAYIDELVAELEEMQEKGDDIDVEYSSGVMTVKTKQGTYVLNKQPPNKQIWLSSPTSGPKRYDWVILGDFMHQKEGSNAGVEGQWIYLRDGSRLSDLLRKEVGVAVGRDDETELHNGAAR